jgi:hypothetical protein
MINDVATVSQPARSKAQIVKEISHGITNPLHKRLLAAYSESNPVGSLELELQNVLLEVLNANESKKD